MVKCESCGYEGVKSEFRYLYNTTLDAETAYRECPKCYGRVVVNELEEEREEKALQKDGS